MRSRGFHRCVKTNCLPDLRRLQPKNPSVLFWSGSRCAGPSGGGMIAPRASLFKNGQRSRSPLFAAAREAVTHPPWVLQPTNWTRRDFVSCATNRNGNQASVLSRSIVKSQETECYELLPQISKRL